MKCGRGAGQIWVWEGRRVIRIKVRLRGSSFRAVREMVAGPAARVAGLGRRKASERGLGQFILSGFYCYFILFSFLSGFLKMRIAHHMGSSRPGKRLVTFFFLQ